jgi:hypothetical protein
MIQCCCEHNNGPATFPFLCMQIIIELWSPEEWQSKTFQKFYATILDGFPDIAFYRVAIDAPSVSYQTTLSTALRTSDAKIVHCLLGISMRKAVFDSYFANLAKTTMHWPGTHLFTMYTPLLLVGIRAIVFKSADHKGMNSSIHDVMKQSREAKLDSTDRLRFTKFCWHESFVFVVRFLYH